MNIRAIVNNLLMKNQRFRNWRSKRKNNISIGRHAKVKLNIFGNNNIVRIAPSTTMRGVITIYGNNNRIEIGEHCSFANISLRLEDSRSSILIGERCHFAGAADISCIEGHSIVLGNDLLVSRNVSIVNGDSHSVLDADGNRINWSNDIVIGNHVWIGKNVNILKNGSIGSNTIIGANSLVTKDFSKKQNVLIAGSPARVIKENVNWDSARLPEKDCTN